MPLYAKKDRTIHHIHIPGCAGTSVSKLLKDNGWHIISLPIPQMFERGFAFEQKEARDENTWNPNYTNHEHKEVWKCWLEGIGVEPEFQFAVVRNPYSRFESCLKKIKNIDEIKFVEPFDVSTINVVSSDHICDDIITFGLNFKNFKDNKFLPQCDFLDNGISVYKIETGLNVLLKDLAEREIIREDQSLENLNSSPINLKIDIPWLKNEYELAHFGFKSFYHQDFENLNYPIREIIGNSNRE